MTAATLRALAADCQRMATEGLPMVDAAFFVLEFDAARKALGGLPDKLTDAAAALLARAAEMEARDE